MKHAHLIILVLLMFIVTFDGFSQETISRTTEKMILESARQTVANYTKYLELSGQEMDKDILSLYHAELFKSVQRDSVNVFNDLTPPADRERNMRDNLERLPVYLSDVSTRYLDGVKLQYSNFTLSKVFVDQARSRLFVKVTADREIDGTYYNKNQKKQNKGTEKIDFYVGVALHRSGVPETRIYSIVLSENNTGSFTEVKVVEKTAAIAFLNVNADTVYRRASEHTLTWSGGELFERLRLDLYRESAVGPVLVTSIDSSFVNDNSINFLIDRKVKPGKRNQYFYQVTKLSSEEAPITSPRFHIRRRTPLLYQIVIPAAVVGGVVFLLTRSNEAAKDPVLPRPIIPE
ncbi:MAG TPA: hypothetical protein VFE50_23335 [Cyclobacteriaceae bacterium]|nr:hypothetical protein [Cyclobacteriaceae bacterium]